MTTFPTTAPEAAKVYLSRGWMPLPHDAGLKFTYRTNWGAERYTPDDAPKFAGVGIGVMLGPVSNGLTDVDLDCPQALRAAAVLLPRTGLVSGRKSARRSHHFYRCDPPPVSVANLIDPLRPKDEKGKLVELRTGWNADGVKAEQTMVAPSVNPDNGEVVFWEEFGEPAVIGAADLTRAVKKVAAAALIGRYWPKHSRHDAALALAGGLLRAWNGDEERVAQFVEAVVAAAEDEELPNRLACVRDTAKKLDADAAKVTGWPKLAEILGERGDVIVSKVREWLDIRANPKVTASFAAPSEPEWPAPPDPAAFHGLAGDLVRAADPYTEADPVAVLVQFLVMFGNRIGRTAYYPVGVTRHYCNEFAVLVGATSKGRKGTSKDVAFSLFSAADRILNPPPPPTPDGAIPPAPSWLCDRVVEGGLSSGEGIIWNVRDPIEKAERVKERGEPVRYEKVIADEGEADKRLMVVEPEFANVLKQTERQGNILSATLRQAFDSGNLRTLTKNNPARATDAHISAVGHITDTELTRYLSQTESANGFANRFMWFVVKRSKALPEPTAPPDDVMGPLSARLADAIRFAETVGEIRRDAAARELWAAVYEPLSDGKPGLAGCLLGRAEAHVTRLAVIYALLDGCGEVMPIHLTAALALWDYAERSVGYVFGDSLGDPVADDLLKLIRQAGTAGVTRTDIQGYLGRNVASDRLSRAFGLLLSARRAHPVKEETAGRPAERWFPGPAPT